MTKMDVQSASPYKAQLDLLDVALFVRAAALSNLSAAGREFGLSAAVASARLAQLERQLGARLLHRTTRRISVTQEGEIFAERARALLGDPLMPRVHRLDARSSNRRDVCA